MAACSSLPYVAMNSCTELLSLRRVRGTEIQTSVKHLILVDTWERRVTCLEKRPGLWAILPIDGCRCR